MRLGFLAVATIGALFAQSAMADIGRVKIVSGSAQVERGGQKIAVKPGFVLEQGDTLVTGKDGKIGVTFADNTRFAAGPNSRVNIADFTFNDTTHAGSFLTRVDKGKVAIISGQIAKANHDGMRVRTPTALLGVRGTRFVVEVN